MAFKKRIKGIKRNLLLAPKFQADRGLELFEEKQMVLAGKKINYAVSGKGEQIIFIHGLSNNWYGWIPAAKLLLDKYQVVIPDLPGYGKSDRIKGYSVQQQAQFIADFIKQLKLAPLTVVGISMGSAIVAKFAKDYPELTGSAVLNAPVFRVHDSNIFSKAVNKGLNVIDFAFGADKALKKIASTTLITYAISKYINMHKFNRRLIDMYGIEGKRMMDQEAFVSMAKSVVEMRIEDVLDGVKVPILMIFGDDDKLTSIQSGKELMAGKRGSFQYKLVKNAGHVVSFEKPAEVVKLIREFLKGIKR